MTHIGLLCLTASGHLNPMTTLGHELNQRGHRVTLVGTLDAQPKVLEAGLEFRAIGEVEFPAGSIADSLAT
jgi:UDP:flavonoid glycosyltransferase YjiC (YdhE family)